MGDGEARVLLATPVDVELACNALGRKQLDGGGRLTVRADPLRDSGYTRLYMKLYELVDFSCAYTIRNF